MKAPKLAHWLAPPCLMAPLAARAQRSDKAREKPTNIDGVSL
jgi:hypothetical protein